MARGGIHDQLGGGFARYSVDATWTVPALREDALRQRAARARLPARLAGLRGDAGCSSVLPARRSTGRCASCAAPEGGFYSALDADSEGVEGRFYVWSAAELRELLGADAAAAIAWFGASERGNFEDAHHPEPG